jgi:hypothetical protein
MYSIFRSTVGECCNICIIPICQYPHILFADGRRKKVDGLEDLICGPGVVWVAVQSMDENNTIIFGCQYSFSDRSIQYFTATIMEGDEGVLNNRVCSSVYLYRRLSAGFENQSCTDVPVTPNCLTWVVVSSMFQVIWRQ